MFVCTLYKQILVSEHPPQVLHVEIATNCRQGPVVRLALERMLLEVKDATLHPKLLLANDEHSIPQCLSLAAPGDSIMPTFPVR